MAKLDSKPFVIHFCKDKTCDAAWLAPDEYGVKSAPARHLYCLDCQVFNGKVNGKDARRVKAGQRLAAVAEKKRLLLEELRDFL